MMPSKAMMDVTAIYLYEDFSAKKQQWFKWPKRDENHPSYSVVAKEIVCPWRAPDPSGEYDELLDQSIDESVKLDDMSLCQERSQ
ncbi:uncharacterized protein N7483_006929 [Penicillium malachiteum]|uniref:uncharacterized protein n=1 Tax=Penicillium malachiteum TaxID=1324776 RepID=UPI0025481B0C|nr:uncharacterized protein N7483_006929 [Penicillium malachiteum]KAJ5725572.1 hypothetical protein N7483_006929 [Penicillium malachiteum]